MNHYELLGLPPSAPVELIRASFEFKARKLREHPDLPHQPTLSQLNVAFSVLSDAALRAAYDREIAHDLAGAARAPLAAVAAAQAPSTDGSAGNSAGFWRRFAACVVDTLIAGLLGALLYAGVAVGMGQAAGTSVSAAMLSALVAWVVVPVAYQTFCNASRLGATPGRYLMGLSIAGVKTGERIGLARSFLRAILSYLGQLLVLPDLVPLFTARRQSLADLGAATVVLQTRRVGALVVAAVGAGAGVLLVGFVGALAALAVPTVQDFATRAQALVVLEQMVEVSQRLEESYHRTGNVETSLDALGYTPKYPGVSIRIEANGVIHAAVPNRQGGSYGTLILVPAETAGSEALTWTCMETAFHSEGSVPAQCRTPYPAPAT